MSQLDKWMVGGKISKLVIVITDKDTGEHVERWQFDVRQISPNSASITSRRGSPKTNTLKRSKSPPPLPSQSPSNPQKPPPTTPTTPKNPSSKKTRRPARRSSPKRTSPRPRSRRKSRPSSAKSPPPSPSSPSSAATAPSTCSCTPTPTATCPSSGGTRTPRRLRTASGCSSGASARRTTASIRLSATGWGTDDPSNYIHTAGRGYKAGEFVRLWLRIVELVFFWLPLDRTGYCWLFWYGR